MMPLALERFWGAGTVAGLDGGGKGYYWQGLLYKSCGEDMDLNVFRCPADSREFTLNQEWLYIDTSHIISYGGMFLGYALSDRHVPWSTPAGLWPNSGTFYVSDISNPAEMHLVWDGSASLISWSNGTYDILLNDMLDPTYFYVWSNLFRHTSGSDPYAEGPNALLADGHVETKIDYMNLEDRNTVIFKQKVDMRLKKQTAILVTAWCVMIVMARGSVAKDMRIYVIDVNNGNWVNESLLIVSPTGKTMLIDAGFPSGYKHEDWNYDYGQNKVSSFLKRLGVKKLDWIMLSHPHDDHIGGIKKLLEDSELKVGEILYSNIPDDKIRQAEPGKYGGEYYLMLLDGIRKTCKSKGIPMKQVHEGQTLKLGGGAVLEILGIAHPDIKVPNYINNNSIIALLTYEKFSMLFTGDAGFEQEDILMKKYPHLRCDILKAGHHAGAGSNSEKWIRQLKPVIAVASAPKWLWKDPRGRDVYLRFQKMYIPVFYTWGSGTIEITTDGIITKIMSYSSHKPLLQFSNEIKRKCHENIGNS